MENVYSFEAIDIEGKPVPLKAFEGKVLLIVNVASKCGFTSQYKSLQEVFDKYKEKGFTVLGFPCNQFGGQEPGTETDIAAFCSNTYDVTFPMFAKVDVNGANAHPLWEHLKAEKPGALGSKAIKWNFTKFLVNARGDVVERYGSSTAPAAIDADLSKLLDSAPSGT